MTSDGRLPPEQRRNYKNVFDALIRISREEGVRQPGLSPGRQQFRGVRAGRRALQFQHGGTVAAFHAVPLGTLLLAVLAAFIGGMLCNAWLRGVRQRRRLRRQKSP